MPRTHRRASGPDLHDTAPPGAEIPPYRPRRRRRARATIGRILAPLLLAAGLTALPVPAGAAPTAVAVPGDFNAAIGCAADWAPACDQAQLTPRGADGIWALTVHLAEGTYAYKAALNRSWDVNYGLHATPGGANIPLTVPAGGATVTFLYDDATHWITDTLSEAVFTAAGDFQSELGCPGDWAPDCLRSWLQDPDGDGTYTFTSTALPAGDYQVKATAGMSWAVNWGQDGVPGGANIPFTVPATGQPVTFSFDPTSHVLSVYAGTVRPSLRVRRAHWLAPDTIAWNLGPDPAGHSYQLAAAPAGGLVVDANGITGGTTIPLTWDPAGLSADLRARYPYLAGLGALRVPPAWAAQAATLLRGQVAVAALDATGTLTDATGLQLPGVLDALYGASAAPAGLGPVFAGRVPTLSLWAPTAAAVSLELYDSATAGTPTLVGMRRDDRTGVWSVTGGPAWQGRYYRYRVSVFDPVGLTVVTNSVTDPYSLALSTDSVRSQLVDLTDRGLAPPGWAGDDAPAALPGTRQEIQELQIRDFSIADATVPADQRGTYLAFTHPGSAGMRHLRELADAGLTTVHLMPAFDFAGTPEVRANQAAPPCDLAGYPPDSDAQQSCVALIRDTDGYNWGYNPWHYTVPEGSYATRTDGAARTVEFRAMVEALHRAGLRVVLDVVYNHTAAAGQDPNSVLDRIVPGYYHRLSLSGAVTTDSCCADTAPEHAMMNKLVVDSVTTWASRYHIDGFRFDLMGLDPKQTMLDVRAALDRLTPRRDGVDGRRVFLYGEGWDFGVVSGNARFVQATQANMAGTGIASFNDRLRDAVRGGGPFDTDPRIQGFASGLYTAPNGDPVNGPPDAQRAALLHAMDLVKVGLTGNLRDYRFTDSTGTVVTGAQVTYNGAPAGYTAAPGEAITYVDAHDNLDLYDALAYKLAGSTTMADRGRLQALALSTTALSQAPGFVMAGSDVLRSKSLDGNSYDSGDWFNAMHWNCGTGNGFGRGLPPAWTSQAQWPYARPLLADPALVPGCATTAATGAAYRQFLAIKRSTPLFWLDTTAAVQQRLSFPLSGTTGEVPGVVTEHLDGRGLGLYRSVTVIWNATGVPVTQTLAGLAGTDQALHPVQRYGGDATVRTAGFDRTSGTFQVPGYTVAVFVQR